MSSSRLLTTASAALVIGVVLGMAGTFVPTGSLAFVSIPGVLPALVRGVGLIASILFAVVALQIFAEKPLTPLSTPLPFFAYPFLAATLFGWAWAHPRPGK